MILQPNMGQLNQICALKPQFQRRFPGVHLKIRNLDFSTGRISYDYIFEGLVLSQDVEMYIEDFISMLRRWLEID